MIEFKNIDNEKTWNSIVEKYPEANFLQSWQWGEVHNKTGHRIERVAILKDGLPIGGFQSITRKAKRGRYMEIPGGPLINWSDSELIKQATRYIKLLARKHRCTFVRIRPQTGLTEPLKKQLKKTHWRKAPMHLHAERTIILDLDQDTETLLKNMRQQTRYEIRRVAKRGIAVKQVSTKQAMKEFHSLQVATADRQQFVPSSLDFLEACREEFGGSIKIYYATKDNQLLNMSIAIFYGNEADYFEAASSLAARKEPGAHGIIWQIIEDAKKMNLSRLNLWGIASSDSQNHRYFGVTTFKRGFGGDIVNFMPAHDLVINPVAYPLNWTVETIRRKRRKL